MPPRSSVLPLCLPRYMHHGLPLCSCVKASTHSSWDPTTSLHLNHRTLVLLETKCTTNKHFKEILAQMMRLHLTTQTFPMSRLIYFSAASHPDNLEYAILLFTHFTPHPNLFIYNTLIAALSFSLTDSANLYNSMLRSFILPDEQTFLALLKASNSLPVCKQLHVHVIVSGLRSNAYVQNSLIKMYLGNGSDGLAREVFRCMPERDSISYNIMISGYARQGCAFEAFALFYDMTVSGVEPDRYTMVGLLVCCGQLKQVMLGKSIHAWALRKMPRSGRGLVLSNALLDMYAKCEEMRIARKVFDRVDERDAISWNVLIAGFAGMGEMDHACRLFEETPCKDLVTWNSLLAGYVRKGDYRRVMKLFESMHDANVIPDKITAIALVSAAAEMGVLNQGRRIHGWMMKIRGIHDAFLGSALIDMYCKCGSIERAHTVFHTVMKKDVALWTAMITGFAFHGYGVKAFELFSQMQEEGLMPNHITLLAVLTACSHAGLVDHAYRIIQDMRRIYNIEPGDEHYGCLVDVLARSGRLSEAKIVIETMPAKPSPSMWGAVLSACTVSRDVELAETATRELIKLKPEEESGYILLSNIYAGNGRWSYSDKIRETMEGRRVKKMPGCSTVTVNGAMHEFYSADKRHPRWWDVYFILTNLQREMRSGTEDSVGSGISAAGHV